MGNLLAGLLGIVYLQDAARAEDPTPLWVKAAWMIFLGMLCDALDGRVARWTRSSSPFGAQLDSLADVVTFGILPALLARSILGQAFPHVGGRLLLGVVAVYVVGATLRLARYNVESARVTSDGSQHVTMMFRGLPSPAAAGTIASLVLLYESYDLKGLEIALLLITPALGLVMISRFPYPHLANRLLEGHRGLPTVVVLICATFLGMVHFVETIAAVFFLYAASGAVTWLVARMTGWPSWGFHEGKDEAPAPAIDDEDDDLDDLDDEDDIDDIDDDHDDEDDIDHEDDIDDNDDDHDDEDDIDDDDEHAADDASAGRGRDTDER